VLFEHHDVFATPADDTPIWRYLDLPRFASMIMRGSVFFVRSDFLGDPFEGAIPQSVLEQVDDFVATDGTPIHRAVIVNLIRGVKGFRERMLVSCWYMDETESAGVWQIYGNGSGVAVKSSVGRLKDSLQTEYRFMIGAINYVDYKTATLPLGNLFWPFVHKRHEFEHEREVRVVIANFPRPVEGDTGSEIADETFTIPGVVSGLEIKADLETMIDDVVVAPDAPDWYLDVVQRLLDGFGVERQARRSELAAVPLWDIDEGQLGTDGQQSPQVGSGGGP